MVTTTPQLANKNPIMQVQGLIREFPAGEDKIRVLHGVDLTIYQGEMVAIIGQSGSGKSTLMNILGCLDQPRQVVIASMANLLTNSAQTNLPNYAANILDLSSRYHLLGDISAQDNVAVPAVYAGMATHARKTVPNSYWQT